MPYTINGRPTSLGAEPRKIDGQLFVPLHALVQQLGGQVNWDNESKTATTTIGQWTAPVNMNSRQLNVNNTPVTLSADPFVEDGVMWVPASFFHDAFGYNVQADPSSEQVAVSMPN
jgi:hypothetical protein